MGNPLQDQLLKAGLVNKKQAKKAKHAQYQQQKQKKNIQDESEAKGKQAALAQRNRELNRQRKEEQQRREQQTQIKQLIEKNRLKQDNNGEPYHFAVHKQIHRIFVTEEMAEQLSRGRLAIVRFKDGFEVVPAKTAQQIAQRDQQMVLVLHAG
ncbi:MAG: DUF2058 family protein [Candidatus Electrothrix sp. AR3]|nr:DUF2058 family protein [Candidatus Electrothrix sp. AR3]